MPLSRRSMYADFCYLSRAIAMSLTRPVALLFTLATPPIFPGERRFAHHRRQNCQQVGARGFTFGRGRQGWVSWESLFAVSFPGVTRPLAFAYLSSFPPFPVSYVPKKRQGMSWLIDASNNQCVVSPPILILGLPPLFLLYYWLSLSLSPRPISCHPYSTS